MKSCPKCFTDVADTTRFCPNCGEAIPAQDAEEQGLVGRTIAEKFLVQELVGEGAMGSIYRAEQITLGKIVCIKVLHPHLTGDVTLSKRFHREARAASRLKHPNAINIIDFGTTKDGTHYIAMEFIDGRDLAQLLKKEFPLHPARMLGLTEQICSALDEAHAQGIIHRDLKPENIMVEDRRHQKDFVTVLDFGIAKIRDPGGENPETFHTMAGIVCGTPEYMSPEQARGEVLDARSDIYSLGVIIYQLSTGKLPFTGDTPIGVVTKHLTQEPKAPREINPNIHPAIEQLIFTLMSKDKELRPSSCMEVKDALTAVRRTVETDDAAFSQTAPMNRPRTAELDRSAPSAPRTSTDKTTPYTPRAALDEMIDDATYDDETLMPHTGMGAGAKAVITLLVLGVLGAGGWFAYDRFFYGLGLLGEAVVEKDTKSAEEQVIARDDPPDEVRPVHADVSSQEADAVREQPPVVGDGTKGGTSASEAEKHEVQRRTAAVLTDMQGVKEQAEAICRGLTTRRDEWQSISRQDKVDAIQPILDECAAGRERMQKALDQVHQGRLVDAENTVESEKEALARLNAGAEPLLAEVVPLGEEERNKKVEALTAEIAGHREVMTKLKIQVEERKTAWVTAGYEDKGKEYDAVLTQLAELDQDLETLQSRLGTEDVSRVAVDFGKSLVRKDSLEPAIVAALKEEVGPSKEELARLKAEEEKRRLEEKKKKELAEKKRKEEEERKRYEAEKRRKEEEERKLKEAAASQKEVAKKKSAELKSKGNEAMGNGDYSTAILYYRQALKAYGSADLHKRLGKAYNAKGDYGKGAKHLNKYLQIMGDRLTPVQIELIKKQIRE